MIQHFLSCDLCAGIYQHVFRVLCLDLGEQELTVAVGNHPTHKNHYPATEETTVRSVYYHYPYE